MDYSCLIKLCVYFNYDEYFYIFCIGLLYNIYTFIGKKKELFSHRNVAGAVPKNRIILKILIIVKQQNSNFTFDHQLQLLQLSKLMM